MRRRAFLKITLPLALADKAASAPSEVPDLAFGLMADPQYANVDSAGSRHFRNSLSKLTDAVAELNTHPLEFNVTLGDLIDRDFESFASVMPIYAKLKGPHFPICGNHDFEVADADKGQVLGAMGLEKAYRSITRKSWRFLFLDGTDIGVWRYPASDVRTAEAKARLEKLAAAGLKQARNYNAAISPEQMEWIDAELEAAQAAGQRVIIFCHYPVIPAADPHNLWNAEELVALFGKYRHIAAYLNGHNHAGNYGQHGNCHYVTLKGMVETEKANAFAVVKCFPDRLEIEGYGHESDRSLEKT